MKQRLSEEWAQDLLDRAGEAEYAPHSIDDFERQERQEQQERLNARPFQRARLFSVDFESDYDEFDGRPAPRHWPKGGKVMQIVRGGTAAAALVTVLCVSIGGVLPFASDPVTRKKTGVLSNEPYDGGAARASIDKGAHYMVSATPVAFKDTTYYPGYLSLRACPARPVQPQP